jgi:hypothetical protein
MRRQTLRPGSLDAVQISQEVARLRALPSLATVRRVLDESRLLDVSVARPESQPVPERTAEARGTRPLPLRQTGPLPERLDRAVVEQIWREAMPQGRGASRPTLPENVLEGRLWLDALLERSDVRDRWARLDLPLQVGVPEDLTAGTHQVRILSPRTVGQVSIPGTDGEFERVAPLIERVVAGTRGPQVLWFDEQTRRGRMPAGSPAWHEAVSIARSTTWDLPLQQTSDPAVGAAGVPARLDTPESMARYVAVQLDRLVAIAPRLDLAVDGETRIDAVRELITLLTLLESSLRNGDEVQIREAGPVAVYALGDPSTPLADAQASALEHLESQRLSDPALFGPTSMFGRASERWSALIPSP